MLVVKMTTVVDVMRASISRSLICLFKPVPRLPVSALGQDLLVKERHPVMADAFCIDVLRYCFGNNFLVTTKV